MPVTGVQHQDSGLEFQELNTQEFKMVLPLPDMGNRIGDLWSMEQAVGAENAIGYGAGQTATGTNKATALAIGGAQPLFEITSAASGTGVQLPVSSPGARVFISNNSSQSNNIIVYTNVNELNVNGPLTVPKIGTTAGTTGITLNSATNAMFHCMTAGQWYKLSGT